MDNIHSYTRRFINIFEALRIGLRPHIITCNRGVSAIEFSLIAPVLLMMIFGTIELSMIMFTTSVMEGATANASRMGKTGFAPVSQTRAQYIRQTLINRTTGLLDSNRIVITTQVYPAMDSIGDPEPYTDANSNGQYDAGEPYQDVNGNVQWDADMAAAGLGNANDVVVYTVTYPWPIATPIMAEIIGNDGIFNITARAVVKNEPAGG